MRDSPGYELIDWFVPDIRKDGSQGKRGTWHYAWYAPLNECELCGRIGTLRRVSYRHELYDPHTWRGTPMVCTGCWNRLRPIYAELRELAELRRIARRLARGIIDV